MSRQTLDYRQYARDVSRRFFGLAVLVPLGTAAVALGSGNVPALNLVHVTVGAAWAGATLYLVGVLSPSLMNLDPPVRSQVTVPLIPKHILLFTSLLIATLLTGIVLAEVMGRDHSAPVMVAAYLAGLALLAVGGYLIHLQGRIYGEVHGEDPDMSRVAALAAKLGKTGVVAGVLQVATLIIMAIVRFA